MPSEEKDFVVDVLSASEVQGIDIELEFLPLSERAIALAISRVSAIDQSKVCRGLTCVLAASSSVNGGEYVSHNRTLTG